MLGKKYSRPIFLLYMITSVLFLTIFTFFYYNINRHNLNENVDKSLANIMREINLLIKLEDINAIKEAKFDGVEVNVFDVDKKTYIKEEFTHENHSQGKKHGMGKGHLKDKFFKQDGEIYLQDVTSDKQKGALYDVTLKSTNYAKEQKAMVVRTTIIYLVSISLFFIISYFIIRLAFRPLLDKINSLNSFIADTTHEINTPLSVILMSIELFDTNPNKYLSNIKTASKTLSGLYDDLVKLNLDSSINKIESVDLKKLVSERVFYFEPMTSEKGIKFSLNLAETSKDTDKIKFSKIIDNLISNAIKYSTKNSIIIINLDAKTMSIENSGEEISKENLDKIYDKFSRFNKNKGGFGIGLSLVKKYCEDLGYKISCTSENKTTKFGLHFS